jgi:hypothetical protein
MPVTFTNLQPRRHLLVPLASGATLRLSPGQSSDEVPDVEIQDSPKIDKLRRQGVLDVAVTADTTDGEQAGKAAGKGESGKGQSRAKAGGSSDTSSPADGGSS